MFESRQQHQTALKNPLPLLRESFRRRSLQAASPVTVFVGSNNSGKSKVLAEIEFYRRFVPS